MGTEELPSPPLSCRLGGTDLRKAEKLVVLDCLHQLRWLAGVGHMLNAEQESLTDSEPKQGSEQFALPTKVGCSGGMNQSHFLIGNSDLETSRTPLLSLLSVCILVI